MSEEPDRSAIESSSPDPEPADASRDQDVAARRMLVRAAASGATLLASIGPRSAVAATSLLGKHLDNPPGTGDAWTTPPFDNCAAGSKWIYVTARVGKLRVYSNNGNNCNTANSSANYVEIVFGGTTTYWTGSGASYTQAAAPLACTPGSVPPNKQGRPSSPLTFTPNASAPTTRKMLVMFQVQGTGANRTVFAVGIYPAQPFSAGGRFALRMSTWTSLPKAGGLPTGAAGC